MGLGAAESVITTPELATTATESDNTEDSDGPEGTGLGVLVSRSSRAQEAEVILASATRFLGAQFPRAAIEELLDEAYGSVADDYGLRKPSKGERFCHSPGVG